MPRHEVISRIDLDPDDTDLQNQLAVLVATAKKNGGFLHIQVRVMK